MNEDRYYDPLPQVTIKDILSLLEKVTCIDRASGVKQTTYMIEESTETIVELGNFIKNLCKFERKKLELGETKEATDATCEEAIDILVTILVFLKRNEVPNQHILDVIYQKLYRTCRVFETEGKV